MASTWQHSHATGSWNEDVSLARTDTSDGSEEAGDGCGDRSSWFMSCLARTIESEIIPRLMLAHRAPSAGIRERSNSLARPGRDDVTELARLAINHEAEVAIAFLEAVAARGVGLESLLLELLAPAARHLGDLWNDDLCDFTAVTVGLGRLQHALHALTHQSPPEAPAKQVTRKALLATVPGEQHTFGVSMVAEFFRQAHWDVCCETGASVEMLMSAVRIEHFDLVGLSVGSASRMETVKRLIEQLREHSCNPALHVMVGGQAILEDPSRGQQVGADSTAVDGRLAVVQTQQMLGILSADSKTR